MTVSAIILSVFGGESDACVWHLEVSEMTVSAIILSVFGGESDDCVWHLEVSKLTVSAIILSVLGGESDDCIFIFIRLVIFAENILYHELHEIFYYVMNLQENYYKSKVGKTWKGETNIYTFFSVTRPKG